MMIRLGLIFLMIGMLWLPSGQVYAAQAELTNLVIRNSTTDLLISLKIKGVFTKEMQDALEKGIPVSFTFLIALYEVHNWWFDEKMADLKTVHSIHFDALKKEYQVARAWDLSAPKVLSNFENARILMSEIGGLKIVSLSQLKKGGHYQLRVKSELHEKKYRLFSFPWEFETDWYTINFIY
jgi:hypothetical protein